MRWKLSLPLPELVCRGINYLDAPNILVLCYNAGVVRCISTHGGAAWRGTAVCLGLNSCCVDTGRSARWLSPTSAASADLHTHPMLEQQSRWRSGYCTWSPEQTVPPLLRTSWFCFSLGLPGEPASLWPSDREDQQRL